MSITFANNAATTLAGAISNTSLTCAVAAGSGVLFPPVTTASGNYFVMTFTDAATGLLREIVHVTNVSGDVLTIVRAQEGTTALNWLAGDLADNLWTAGSVTAIINSTQQFLTANLSVFVATTGSDTTGNGTSTNPWATLQHAFNYVQQYYNFAGFTVTINVANGTYTTGVVISSPTVGGIVNFVGNPGSPSSVIISVSNSNCFESGFANFPGANIGISGFELTATGSPGANTGYAIVASGGAVIGYQNIDFSTCSSGHVWASVPSLVYAAGPYTISGGAPQHWLANLSGSTLEVLGQTITLSGTPAFSTAFALVSNAAVANVSGNNFVGSGATGARYSVNTNGVINTAGGGASYLPGSSGGTSASGGQYV